MPETLYTRLESRARAVNSLLCVGLDPHPEMLANASASAALAFCKRIVEATHAAACAFKPNSAFFEALGSMGYEALRALIEFIHALDPAIPVILDAKRGDIASTADAYARAAFDYLGADAVTVNPYLGRDAVAPFLKHAGKGAFVLCHTSNPGAADFQHLDCGGAPLYARVGAAFESEIAAGALGLVAGATDTVPLEHLRQLEATRPAWLLVPGVGAQGGDLESAVRAAVRPDGLGALINVSRGIAAAAIPGAEAIRLRDAINLAAYAARQGDPGGAALASALYEAGCVRFGEFTLKSGAVSPIYLDLRRLVASPSALKQVAGALAERIRPLPFDHLAAIPYAALPIGTAVALALECSLIYPRREVKEYGTKAAIEGVFEAGQTALVLDDLATTGGSKFEAIDKLKAAGLNVRDVVVVIDREQGAAQTLAEAGYRLHALITLTALLDALQALGRIDAEQRARVDAYLASQRESGA